jgi:multiple sugar transport system ATP-binding protein
VFLFDEPLSNLDAKLRVQTRREIAKLHRDLRATMIYVTHDQVEAMTLGDRIVVMNAGRVQQVDTPLALYDRPANRFVAGFIGSPAMNFVEGAVADQSFVAADNALVVPIGERLASRLPSGRRLVMGVRPEDVAVSRVSIGESPSGAEHATVTVPARIDLLEPLGNETLVHATVGSYALTARALERQLPDVGANVSLGIEPAKVHWFDQATGDRIDPSASGLS